jgi:DNA-binding NarL/FixJ family response regulator
VSEAKVYLTPRQDEVLRLLANGLTTKQAARAMGITHRTVMAHIGAMVRALGANTRAHAVERAHEEGIL